jgi:hypothetical protein
MTQFYFPFSEMSANLMIAGILKQTKHKNSIPQEY